MSEHREYGEAFESGRLAALSDEQFCTNPYKRGTQNWLDWRVGWLKASHDLWVKRNEAK